MDEKELKTFIEQVREGNREYHIIMAQGWRRYGEPKLLHVPLAYAAFEYRCGIERLAFELLYLLRDQKPLQSDLERARRFSELVNLIYEIEGNKKLLYKKMLFNQLLVHSDDTPFELSIPDLDKLKGFWSDLSEYCHGHFTPGISWKSPEWIKKGYKLLNEVENYLRDIVVTHKQGWYNPLSLQPEILEMRNEFLEDKLTEEQVKIRLNLINPILARRMRQR